MPRLSRWLIRTALLYLLAGFTLGGLLLSAKAGAVDARVWVWLLPHADILMAGWLVQLSMGVSYWILPRIREAGRGRVPLAWAAYILLNSGLIIGAGLPLLGYWLPSALWIPDIFTIGLLVQAVALLVYVIYAWPRILPTITAADWQRKGESRRHQ